MFLVGLRIIYLTFNLFFLPKIQALLQYHCARVCVFIAGKERMPQRKVSSTRPSFAGNDG